MMQTSCKNSAGGQREGEDGEDGRGEHTRGEGSLVQLPVSHYLSHLLDRTGDGWMKGTTVV